MAIDEKLFGLMSVAEEQQQSVTRAIEALTREAARIATERAAIQKTIETAVAAAVKANGKSLTSAADHIESVARRLRWKHALITLLVCGCVAGALFCVVRYQLSQIADNTAVVNSLDQRGARAQMTLCGTTSKPCIRVDTSQMYMGGYYIISGY